ncbi:Outer membrane protein assembly factor BamB, contains PQQ-like beta-propeller repeat [Flavobacterium succinicans]|jgi:outer membrane protein assembly factor BamB|uniref:Outer membrane protein assembly factor BamB, contains PQQ-like beta-propeller repeat n=1 Tax=Flavobacterium succinicans TaxID=29536 RepID=A0A1I4VAW0_9FLAO|nr:PQQ-binding-like beta-propeller repeat protein [Flavobacterium succinicans]SFM98309.1 Outer membrane protein assembly factor BamB, contains PQQ-like beta-propeller repeat [Flavobacterium succinicans]
MKKITYSALLVLLVCVSAISQRKYDEIIKTENSVQDLVQNEITGIVVFKEGGTVKGVDPETKKIIWTLTKDDFGSVSVGDIMKDGDFGNLFKDKKPLSSVAGSPYVEAYINNKYIIINTDSGKIVYNSSKESFWVMQSDFIPETDEYLLTLKKDGDMTIALLDMKTGELKWNTPVDKAKSLFDFSLKLSANTNIAKVNGMVIYYLLYGKLYSFDRSSGKLNWKANEEEYSKFFVTQNDKNIVVVNSQGVFSSKEYLNVLSTDTGKSIWKESIKTKKVVYLEDWGSKLLIAHYSGFNFYDLKTGEKIWKKDARGDGLKRVIPIDQDFLYVAENEMMLINKEGEKLWKKFIEISDDKEDPIYYLGKVGEKVMYLTGTYGNMVDYKSGKKLWKRNIEFDKTRPVLPTFEEASNSYLVYNDEKLYKFNPTIDDKPEPFAKVNIKNEKELNSIELFPWGVVLAGPVEVMGVSMDGAVKYHHIYKQPGETGRRLLKSTALVGSAVMGGAAFGSAIKGSELTMETRDANGNKQVVTLRERDKTNMAQAEGYAAGAAALGMIAEKFGSRFNAMKQNRDFSYIFAKTETGEKMLVKVRKIDGVEVDKITFTNNQPQYEIDPATQNIFYVSDNSIQIFNKK